jgi:hypothetical protein
MLICTSNAQSANSRLTDTVTPVILPTVNSAGNAALQLTDAQLEGYRAALDDVRAEIGALAGTGLSAHDAAIASALELVEKLKFRNRVAVAPQRGAKVPALDVPPNDGAGTTGRGTARQGAARLGGAGHGPARRGGARLGEAGRGEAIPSDGLKRHFETIRRYSLGLPTRG